MNSQNTDIEKFPTENFALNQLGSGFNLVDSNTQNYQSSKSLTNPQKKEKSSYKIIFIILLVLIFLIIISGIIYLVIFLKKSKNSENHLKPIGAPPNSIDKLINFNSTLSQMALNKSKKDPQFDNIMSKLDNNSSEIIQKGFIYQYLRDNFVHFSSDLSIVTFYPINVTDYYLFEINKSNNSQIKVNANNNDLTGDPLFSSQSSDSSQNFDNDTKMYNVSFTIADTAENQVEVIVTIYEVNLTSIANPSSDPDETDEIILEDIGASWNSTDKDKLITQAGDKLIINFIHCQFTRGQIILFCIKPQQLDDVVFVMMLNALSLYLPNFSKEHMNIFLNSNNQIQNNGATTTGTSTSSTSMNIQTDSNGNVNQANLQSSTTSNDSSLNVLNIPTENQLNATTLIDPYTGKVLHAQWIGKFNSYPKNDQNYTDDEKQFFKSLNSNTTISIYYLNTVDDSNNITKFFYEYLDTLPYDNITDPINQLTKTDTTSSSFTNDANGGNPTSNILVDYTGVFMDRNIIGINFYGWYEITCYITGSCKFLNRIETTFGTMVLDICEPIDISPFQKMYKSYAFLKSMVLDNISSLMNLFNEIKNGISHLVNNFLKISKNIINDISTYINQRKPDIVQTIDNLIGNSDGLLNFTTEMFPIMEQTFTQLGKDIAGLTSQELSAEYQLYYNTAQNISQILQEEIIIIQQSMSLQLPKDQLTLTTDNINNFLTNYDKLTNNLYSEFIKYDPIISTWSSNIVNITAKLMYQNDIFHYLEAIDKLSGRYFNVMSNDNNTYIIDGSANELNRSYMYFLGTLNQTFKFQRDIIQNSLNTLNGMISNYVSNSNSNSNTIASEQVAVDLMMQNSILFNQSLYDKLFTFNALQDIRTRLDNIYTNQINLKLAYLKEQFQIKYDFYLNEYLGFYELIQNEINQLISLIYDKDIVNIKNLIDEAFQLYQQCKSFVDSIFVVFAKLIDPTHNPTADEILKMKSSNLVQVEDFITETFTNFSSITTKFYDYLHLIPSTIYDITHPNGRLLLDGNINIQNIYDDTINFINNGYISINSLDSHLINQFFTSTKFLEISNTSFFQNVFSNFQNQKTNFLGLHNLFINDTLLQFVLNNVMTYKVQSQLIQALKSDLTNLIPAEGIYSLVDYNCIHQITIPLMRARIFLFSFSLDINFGYSVSGKAVWGFNKLQLNDQKLAQFYLLFPYEIQIFGQVAATLSFIIFKISVSLQFDLILAILSASLNIDLSLTSDSYFLTGNMQVDLFISPMTTIASLSIQHLVLHWRKIHLFWKIYIYIPVFTWSNPINLSSSFSIWCYLAAIVDEVIVIFRDFDSKKKTSMYQALDKYLNSKINAALSCQQITLMSKNFLKLGKIGLDPLERYAINLASQVFFDDIN